MSRRPAGALVYRGGGRAAQGTLRTGASHCVHSSAGAGTGENRVWVGSSREGCPGRKEQSAGGGRRWRDPSPGASPLRRSCTATTMWASVPASLRSRGWASWPPEPHGPGSQDPRAAAADQPPRCGFAWDLTEEPASCLQSRGWASGWRAITAPFPSFPAEPSLSHVTRPQWRVLASPV